MNASLGMRIMRTVLGNSGSCWHCSRPTAPAVPAPVSGPVILSAVLFSIHRDPCMLLFAILQVDTLLLYPLSTIVPIPLSKLCPYSIVACGILLTASPRPGSPQRELRNAQHWNWKYARMQKKLYWGQLLQRTGCCRNTQECWLLRLSECSPVLLFRPLGCSTR